MKQAIKFFLFSALSLLIVAASVEKTSAQSSGIYTLKSQYNLTIDTILTGNLTKTLTLKNGSNANLGVTGYAKVTSVQLDIAKISGTVGGTATVQGSVDGVTWYTATNSAGSAATYTITDATQTAVVKVTDGADIYWRVLFVGTGTMSAQVKARLWRRN